jgi:hypothetical protein
MPSLVSEARTVLGFPALPSEPPPEDELAAAFKKLALKWHPDRNRDNAEEATQRFAEISAARDLLVDPPAAALIDEPLNSGGGGGGPSAAAAAQWRSAASKAHSAGLRDFENDVSAAIDDGSLAGPEVDALFDMFELWAVWACSTCDALCCRIRKNKYACMCGHRLREHRPGAGFRCGDAKCGCRRYEFQVQYSHEPVKCSCKHAASQHAATPPRGCLKPGCECAGFSMAWVCHCGHSHAEHKTAFVRKKYTERAREWVTSGLRPETLAMAAKFRSRTPADRAAFIARAAAAKALGLPSWKAVQREAAARAKWATEPEPSPGPHGAASLGGGGDDADASPFDAMRCGECEDGAAGSSAPSAPYAVPMRGGGLGGGLDRAAAGRAGFSSSNETTHGLSTAELREKLAEAGIGIRAATAADFGR